MNIIQTLTAISPGLTSSFLGVSGVEPYTYSVKPGGAGGSIDSNGVYTAPDSPTDSFDIIEVTDSDLVPVVAEASINILTPHQLVLDIVKKELGLADDQLFLWNQKVNVPNDKRLYIDLAVVSTKILGNTKSYSTDGIKQIQSTNIYDMITLGITSKDVDALERRIEVLQALKSDYAQSQQEANSFSISNVSSSFVNLSRQEGNALLYAFGLSLTLSYFKKKITNINYYDTFQNTEVTTNS